MLSYQESFKIIFVCNYKLTTVCYQLIVKLHVYSFIQFINGCFHGFLYFVIRRTVVGHLYKTRYFFRYLGF